MDKKRELFEVKDDEEQQAKLVDICDLLLAAGYFRVRLKGLSAFDKVVGGIVWCLEMCAEDVDVNFLFRENLNIGEKLEITEKIIQVLLAMNCVYALEPHQIQGLDTVKIFPVVQWLVKKAMETRESLSNHLNAIAAIRYRKSFPISQDELKMEQTAWNVPKLFQNPPRKFKKVCDPEKPLLPHQQVIATLMEYGQSADVTDDPSLQSLVGQQQQQTQHSQAVVPEKRAIIQRVSLLLHQQAETISQSMEDYTLRQPERQGEKDELALLQQSQTSVTDALKRVVERIASQDRLMEQLNTKLSQLSLAEQQLAEKKKSLAQLETPENRQILKDLDDVIKRNETLNAQRKEFKIRCKSELDQLQKRNESLDQTGGGDSTDGDGKQLKAEQRLSKQLVSVGEQLAGAKKTLGEKNVNVLRLRRQLDSVPGNAELNQYQRRFTELCLQVSEKQTELNGYYLLYNSLEDTKVYLDKELSLLSSIHDKFSQSMQSNAGRTEFLQQMEKIVSAVHQNKTKIEKQIEMLKEKQEDLAACLEQLAGEEQNYRDTIKAISYESQKYKQLTSTAV